MHLAGKAAPSNVEPAAEASHKGAAAGMAAHHAGEEDETAMEGARATSYRAWDW